MSKEKIKLSPTDAPPTSEIVHLYTEFMYYLKGVLDNHMHSNQCPACLGLAAMASSCVDSLQTAIGVMAYADDNPEDIEKLFLFSQMLLLKSTENLSEIIVTMSNNMHDAETKKENQDPVYSIFKNLNQEHKR